MLEWFQIRVQKGESMNSKRVPSETQSELELEIIELDGRFDMSVDAFGLLALNDQFFADDCACNQGCVPPPADSCPLQNLLTGCGASPN
jgi:hypothetical protein